VDIQVCVWVLPGGFGGREEDDVELGGRAARFVEDSVVWVFVCDGGCCGMTWLMENDRTMVMDVEDYVQVKRRLESGDDDGRRAAEMMGAGVRACGLDLAVVVVEPV
jgi:hypothetical protein